MLDIALKEWAVICDLLLSGEQVILLRKGGVHEDAGPGRFRLEHNRFVFFPAWEHQKPDWIKPGFRDRVEVFDHEPERMTLRGFGVAERIWQVPSRVAFDRLDDLHGWERPQIDMRFNYKPERPLYLLAVRAYTLIVPKEIEVDPRYWGCKSWVDLKPEHTIDDSVANPVIGDDGFAKVVGRIDHTFAGTSSA